MQIGEDGLPKMEWKAWRYVVAPDAERPLETPTGLAETRIQGPHSASACIQAPGARP